MLLDQNDDIMEVRNGTNSINETKLKLRTEPNEVSTNTTTSLAGHHHRKRKQSNSADDGADQKEVGGKRIDARHSRADWGDVKAEQAVVIDRSRQQRSNDLSREHVTVQDRQESGLLNNKPNLEHVVVTAERQQPKHQSQVVEPCRPRKFLVQQSEKNRQQAKEQCLPTKKPKKMSWEQNSQILSDGCYKPRTEPKRNTQGFFEKPRGRSPKGFKWDYERGVWAPLFIGQAPAAANDDSAEPAPAPAKRTNTPEPISTADRRMLDGTFDQPCITPSPKKLGWDRVQGVGTLSFVAEGTPVTIIEHGSANPTERMTNEESPSQEKDAACEDLMTYFEDLVSYFEDLVDIDVLEESCFV